MQPNKSKKKGGEQKHNTNDLMTSRFSPSDLRHVGDEKRQPGAEEQPQEDAQGQTGLQGPPPVPVGQATLAVHRGLWMVKGQHSTSNIYLPGKSNQR